MSIRVAAQTEDFDVAAELARLEALGGGGIASFTGVVRGGEGLTALHLETYAAMTDRALADIAAKAAVRWPLLGITLLHRHGTLAVGERIVLVATASRHRAAALESCAFLIDWAKTHAPFWKREIFADGAARWVEAHAADEAATAGWAFEDWEPSAEEGRP
ncbi:MAG: molybdopterin synthase subunit MoaE [Sphingomonas bacterium]|jgi:molybdopterin synthase catalytic subunit|nr:molybdopterin synthase subunit MoaE [Sphingomonas bacterium]